MITVDFFGGSDLSHKKRRIIIHRRHGRATRENGSAFRRQRRRRLVASTRRARCWNGASSSRLKFTRIRSSLFFIHLSSFRICKCLFIGSKPTSLCDRRRLLREARLSRCRVAHHSLSLFSFHLTSLYRIARALTRTGTDDQRRHDDGERRDL